MPGSAPAHAATTARHGNGDLRRLPGGSPLTRVCMLALQEANSDLAPAGCAARGSVDLVGRRAERRLLPVLLRLAAARGAGALLCVVRATSESGPTSMPFKVPQNSQDAIRITYKRPYVIPVH